MPAAAEEAKECRMCLDSGGPDLIAPCMCRGSQQWVHRGCLDTWRATKAHKQAFTNCTTCTFKYRIHHRRLPAERQRLQVLWHRLLIVRDLSLLALAVAASVVVAGLCIVDSRCLPSDIAWSPATGVMLRYGRQNMNWPVLILVASLLLLSVMGVVSVLLFVTGHFPEELANTLVRLWDSLPGFGGNCFFFIGGFSMLGTVVLVVMVFVGLLVGIGIATTLSKIVMQRNWKARWLTEETKLEVVVDLHGKEIVF